MSFDHLNTIYRSFDIRGKFPEEITPEEVEKIGKAIVTLFNAKKVAVGRDIRPSADTLFEALTCGLTSQGCSVIDLGLTTTPMTYYFGGSTDVDATVMITASHMPSEYNGLKITIEDAKPVTADVLQEIKKIVGEHTFSSESTEGSITTHAMQESWVKSFKDRFDLSGANFSVVIDPANMIGALEIDTFKAFEPDIKVQTIYEELDHTCPNHEANPIKHETLEDLGKKVVSEKADLGVAFDGDADRIGFVDEAGAPVPSDLIGILLVRSVLAKHPKTPVVFDIRSTKALKEEVERLGGKPIREKVGHTFIRTTMRKHDAVVGIELAGHFFFKDTFFSEGGPLPAFLLLELMKQENKRLSELITEVRKYAQSGEINSEISRSPEEIYARLREVFNECSFDTTDGLTIEGKSWWCNVRPSANDPVMRMNLEADTEELMEKMRDQVLAVIRD